MGLVILTVTTWGLLLFLKSFEICDRNKTSSFFFLTLFGTGYGPYCDILVNWETIKKEYISGSLK